MIGVDSTGSRGATQGSPTPATGVASALRRRASGATCYHRRMEHAGTSEAPVGLIAGQGHLPIIIARGMREAGRRVACVGLRDQFDPRLCELCDQFAEAGIIRLGRWIHLLQRWGVREAIMVGRVRKARMFEPLRLVRQMPDWRAAKLWYGVLRHDRRNDAILSAVANELQRGGITLIDSTTYIPDHMAGEGVLTRTQPTAAQHADIAFGVPIVLRMGDLDIGQAIAVRDREVIAVEAIEGTDAMIERAGQLCRSGRWVLIKFAKPAQDMRFDVPTVGLQTIENVKASGGGCIAVEAHRTILIDKPQLLAAADAAGIAVVGVNGQAAE